MCGNRTVLPLSSGCAVSRGCAGETGGVHFEQQVVRCWERCRCDLWRRGRDGCDGVAMTGVRATGSGVAPFVHTALIVECRPLSGACWRQRCIVRRSVTTRCWWSLMTGTRALLVDEVGDVSPGVRWDERMRSISGSASPARASAAIWPRSIGRVAGFTWSRSLIWSAVWMPARMRAGLRRICVRGDRQRCVRAGWLGGHLSQGRPAPRGQCYGRGSYPARLSAHRVS
ncbi:hypothetical protein J3R03_008221 [Actinoplanes couchii]|nr:hypothetical protein [Actinoplanes couchii]